MKKINLFSRLWSSGGNSQSSDVGYDSRSTVGSPSGFGSKSLLKFVSVLVLVLTIGVGNVWGYTITFTNNANSATAISSSVTAATTIASASRTYVNSSPYTVNSGNCYYGGDGKNNIRIGKSGANAGLSIALSASGQVSASTIVVNCMVMTGTKNTGATLSVNGAAAQTAPTSADNLTFTINDDITSITLSSTKAVFIYSITVNTGGGASVATPTFSVAEGTYNSNQSVTISCATAGSTIYYTTNGTTPTSSSTAYSSAVAISSTTTLKAIAIKGGTNSSVASATYTLKCATPTFSPAAGTYGAAQSVSISTTYGTNIYYTTDGTTPTTSSTLYSSAFSVSSTQTIKAIATKTGCSDSDEGSAAYTINIPYTVSFSTGTGNPTQGNISEASAGAGITLPAGPTPRCSSDGWSFAGWGYESCDDESAEPTLYIAGNKYYPSSNETLYAVYVKGKTASTNYRLIDEAAEIVSGENYVIAAYYNSNDYAITAEIQSSYYIKQTAVTVTENVISSPVAKTIWQLTNEGGSNVSLYNSNQSKYLYVYASGSYRNLGLYDSKKQFTMTEEREAGYASTFAFNSTDYTSYYINYDASHTDFGTKTSSDENLYLYKRQYTGTYESNPTCCTPLGSITGTFTSSNLSQSSGVLTATLPSASKNANATSYRFTLYNNSDEEIMHTDVATGSGDVSTTFSSPSVTAGNTYKVSVTPLVSPQGSFCSTTGTESDKASITMQFTVTLAVNNAEYGSISPTSTLYVASGTSISASTNTLSVGATNITATYTPQTAQYTYGFTNWTWSPSGSTITANTTATANFSRSTRNYNVTTTGITHATASPAIPATVAYGGSITTTITAESGYHLPTSITVSGATLDNWNSSTGALSIIDVTGIVTITITGEENSCDAYSFHTGGSDVWNTRAENKCFVQDGSTKRWYISNYTITSNTHFCLNWQGGKYDRGGDNNVRFMTQPWTEMSLAYGRSGKVGVATGAVGTIQMYANSSDDNLYVGFIPDGYVLKYNGVNEVMTQSSTYVWYAPTPYTINSTTQGYTVAVGLNDGSDNYVACDNTAAVKHIFVKVDHSDWTAAAAKYELYNIQTSSFVGEYMRAVPGETNLYEGWIPSGCTSIIIARCNPGAAIPTGNTWTNVWNQTQNITLDGSKNYYTINSKDGSNKYYGAWSVYEKSGKWYLDLDGTTTGGQKNFSCYFYPHYVLHYDANSGSGAPADQSVALDASPCQLTVSSTVPTRAGYTFLGWNQSSSATTPDGNWDGGDMHAMTADVTLYAVWAANHTLSYDYNGGDGSSCVGGTKYTGESFTACSSAGSKTGYTFNNWLGSNSTSYTAGTTYTMPNSDLTLTAQWKVQEYTITYKDQGDAAYSGSNGASLPTTHTYGVATDLVDGVKSGYRFDGWFTDASCTISAGSSIGATAKTADFTLYAKWTQVYTVTWYVNGDEWESGVVSGNTQVPSGTKVSALPTAPTTSDCDDSKVFVGWKAAEIDGVSVSDPGGIFTTQGTSPTISANTNFYAVFADESGGDFTRVTNVATQIEAGKKVIMGYEATANSGVIVPLQSNALNGTLLYTGTTEGSAGSGTLTMSSMSSGDEAIYAFTIRAGHNSGYWAFEMSGDNEGKYLSHNGKNSITNAESVTNDGKTDFSIVLGTNDVATITNKYGNENTTQDGKNYYNYKIFCYNYNNGNPRAAIYRATQTGDFVMYLCNPLTYSNYVTSCSSCDADATFTYTTPAVSDIDCTSATLTATGGLATVGADGCHVSDYGFVIGTSDNPVIGGSGVTKLQVGTSDPTIGDDFSYEATDLTKGTRYYIRAYAINRHGTAYSSSTNFWTNNVSSIAITTAPTKTNYIEGETFDATGMLVTATMASDATEDVTSDVTYSSSALTAGTSQNFAINYTLCETAKSVNQVINVYTLTVTEGANPSYGTATNSSANIVSITGLGDHKTYTVTVTSSNATAVDNGDNTWSIINPTGNVTVRVDYADAVQVKVYYKVDGVTVTGLTQDVYQSETTTLPTASELATAMTAQSMDLPDDDYPNFVGWSETEFPAQTAEPTIVRGTPAINAEKTYYAVFTNLGQIHLSADNLVTTYPSTEKTVNVGSKDFKYHYLGDANISGTHVMQFKKHSSEYGYIYNNDALSNILRIEIGYYSSESNVPVYAASAAGTIAGDAITPASRESTDPYVYTFPASTSYFMVKGNNSYTYKIRSIDIYYASSTVYYMTQFCTRYTITGASTGGTNVNVNGNVGGRLTSGANSLCSGKSLTLSAAVNAGYNFGSWTITGATSGDLTSTLLGANASSMTPPAFTMPAENLTVSATITEKEVTGWTWKQELADASEITIPATVDLYIGQQAKFNLKTYDPADVIAGKKGYDATYTNTDLAQDSKAGAYYITRAKIAKESTMLTLTSTSNGTVQEVITIRIKALPLVHFVDLVHGETFADVVANVDASEKRTVYTTKPTPTHSDVSDPGASYNTCEREHLHLIGWIESEWADEHPNADNDAIKSAGAGNYYAAGADINLVTQNGKTYYAVWTIIE